VWNVRELKAAKLRHLCRRGRKCAVVSRMRARSWGRWAAGRRKSAASGEWEDREPLQAREMHMIMTVKECGEEKENRESISSLREIQLTRTASLERGGQHNTTVFKTQQRAHVTKSDFFAWLRTLRCWRPTA